MSIGRWLTGLSTPPDPADGIAIGGGWALHVQLAAVDSLVANGTIQPAWYDVTANVVDVAWRRGDASAESRLPVGSGSVRLKYDGWLIGTDPMASVNPPNVNDRFGAGYLIRWGYRRIADDWWLPLFTGFIDTITEDWSASFPTRPRILELDVFEASYYLAGYRNPSTYDQVNVTQFGTAFNNLLSATDWPFTYYVFAGVPLTATMAPAPPQNPLPLLHRLADSVGASVWCLGEGTLVVSPWAYRSGLTAGGAAQLHVMDGNVDAGFGTYTGSNPVLYPIEMRFVNSMDRMLYRAVASSTYVAGATSGRSTTPVLTSRYSWRVDRSGWPKNDLLFTAAVPGQPFDADAAATRANDTVRCDSVTFDSLSAGRGSQLPLEHFLAHLLTYSELHSSYQLQRRRFGTAGIYDRIVTVGGVSGLITRDRNLHRLRITHDLRTV